MRSKFQHAVPAQPAGRPAGTLLAVSVGMPKDVPWQGKTVFTGVFKDAVTGPRRVRKLNVDGDGQGDLAGHGGEQRAVFVYQIDSYRHWEHELGRDDFVYGQFGENFTDEHLRNTALPVNAEGCCVARGPMLLLQLFAGQRSTAIDGKTRQPFCTPPPRRAA